MSVAYKYEKDEMGREYAVFDDVPVFDEHTGEDGVDYDARLLKAIATTCNDRIEDTGDYCPLVTHHTTEDKDPAKQPEVIGFAGPYRLGKIGAKNPRWAILARFRVFKDRLKDFLARPRRSVEIWPEDKPEKRYFDPIALLGAETPQRDLGLIYSRTRHGQKVIRYEMSAPAAMPGSSNTSIPKYEKEPSMTISPEDIQQIVEALGPVIDQKISERMESPSDEPLPQDDIVPEGDGEDDEPAGDVLPPEEPVTHEEPDGDEEPDETDEDMAPAQFAKMADRYKLADEKSCDCDGAKKYMASLPGRQRKALDRYMKGDKPSAADKALYAKCCVRTDSTPATYQRSADAAIQRYEKEKASDKIRYHKLQVRYEKAISRCAELADELTVAKGAIRYAKHSEELTRLEAEGVVLDRDAELTDLMAMSESDAVKHLERIATHYSKLPKGSLSPGDISQEAAEVASVRYSKKAGEVTQDLRDAGVKVDYSTVLKYMVVNNGAIPTKDSLS